MAIGTPTQLGSITLVAVSSPSTTAGSPSAIPIGTLIVLVLNINAAASAAINSVSDSAGNTYNLIQPATNATNHNGALAWLITSSILPSGTTWTITAGAVFNLKGIWTVSGAAGGLDQFVVSNNTATNSGVTLTTGTLATQNNIAFAYTFPHSASSAVSHGTWTDLFNNGINDFTYLTQTGSQAAVSFAPTWSPASNSSSVLAVFRQTQAANLPVVVALNTTNNSSTLKTTSAIPINSLVIVTLRPVSGAFVVSTLTDGLGTTYAQAVTSSGSFPTILWYSVATAHTGGAPSGTAVVIPAGTTFTATGTDPSATSIVSIAYVQGYNGGLDVTSGAQTGASVTTFDQATGALALPGEIVFGAWQLYVTATGFTEGSGFTTLVNELNFAAGLSYDIPGTSTASVHWQPSWTPANQASAVVAAFLPTPFPTTTGWEIQPFIRPKQLSRNFGALAPSIFIEATLTGSGFTLVRSSNENFGPPVTGAHKYYYEAHVDSSSIVGQMGVGFDNGTEDVHGPAAIGAICWNGDGSVNYNGGLAVYNAGPFSVGDTLGVAIDYVSGNVWFRVGAGNWNNNALADPATNVGGFAFTATAIGGVIQLFAISQLITGSSITPNYTGMNATPFANGPPTGFSPWQGFTGYGWSEVETFPVRNTRSRFNALIGKCQFTIPSQQGFTPLGWDSVATFPVRNISNITRSGAAYGESVYAIPQGPKFVPDGWEETYTQPPHPRREKFGTIVSKDDGITLPFVYVPFVPSFGSYATTWSDPPHFAPEKRFGAIAPFDDSSYLPATRLQFYGWEVLPWQPPHPRPEKWGALSPWNSVLDSPFAPPTVALGPGFEVQPWQPPHLRTEVRGTVLIVGDDSIYLPYVFTPPPPPPPPGAGKRYQPPTDYLPEPAFDKAPNKPVQPIWDRPTSKPSPAVVPSGPPPLPPLTIFGDKAAPRIIDMRGLPTFQEYVPENPLAMHQRMQQAMDESDALAALRAIGLLKDK